MNDKYKAMSDSELSGEVLKAIYGDVVDYWCASDCEEYIYDCGPAGDQFYKINLININNWNDIMSIAVEYKISLSWYEDAVGIYCHASSRKDDDIGPYFYHDDESPQRAIAICFLRLQELKNER